jgi:hypothetical protein
MVSSVATYDFDIYAGNAYDHNLIYEESGVAVTTITKATLTFKRFYGAQATVTKEAVLVPSLGEMTFSFTGVETAALVPSRGEVTPQITYLYDITLELSSGLSPVTIQRGTATVTGAII